MTFLNSSYYVYATVCHMWGTAVVLI